MTWFFQQGVDPAALSAAVSHFLNCFLSSSPCFLDSCSDELASRRRSRRRRSHRGRVASLKDNMWSKLTPAELWSRIRSEARDYFHYTINRCVRWGCLGVVCRMLQPSSVSVNVSMRSYRHMAFRGPPYWERLLSKQASRWDIKQVIVMYKYKIWRLFWMTLLCLKHFFSFFRYSWGSTCLTPDTGRPLERKMSSTCSLWSNISHFQEQKPLGWCNVHGF